METGKSVNMIFIMTLPTTCFGITLKVMAGDRIDILGKSYYFQNNTGGSGANSNVAVLELLSGLLGSPNGATANSHTTATELSNIAAVSTPIAGSYLNDPGRENPYYLQRPRAFINYIFLDDQFRYTGTGGFSAVNNTAGLKDHLSELQNKVAPKNGYVYIYVSNESPVNVFFDNLQVVHTRGPILEETHYYPFGLIMNGISSKALIFGQPENKKKFNGIEHTSEFDLNTYDAFFRNADPQIGRWWQIDPKPNYFESTFSMMGNNPIKNVDYLGDTTYLFNKRGQYKGVIYDNLKTNEVVILNNRHIKAALYIQKNKHLSNDVLAGTARNPGIAYARITGNTINALNKQWSGLEGKEAAGYLYIDRKSKEVQVYTCKECGTSAASASMEKLASHYNEISKLGKILGVWHTHPANSFDGSQPSRTAEAGMKDYSNPLRAMNGSSFGLGMIVTQTTGTIYPLTSVAPVTTGYEEDPLVTTPKYSKDFRGEFQSTFQFAVFNSQISPQTNWKR